MQLPYFFEEKFPATDTFILSEESSKHIIQVLRMHAGEQLLITNGKGELLTANILSEHKKKTEVKIESKASTPRPNSKVSIAISLIKNANRFEWFLEKATEIGVAEIIPIICSRTEKHQMKWDRMQTILTSAMLQSRQAWLPELKEPMKISDLVKSPGYHHKFIAHCHDTSKKKVSNFTVEDFTSIILIGPEGDFTQNEVTEAIENNYIPVSLGQTRLRTETAGIVAAALLLNK